MYSHIGNSITTTVLYCALRNTIKEAKQHTLLQRFVIQSQTKVKEEEEEKRTNIVVFPKN